ncbi:MAG: hypothetical protein K2X55_24425 [Burkholderiaceae bacterium]|nr:hypothetical protein [Burkholderiaceae bacterium]
MNSQSLKTEPVVSIDTPEFQAKLAAWAGHLDYFQDSAHDAVKQSRGALIDHINTFVATNALAPKFPACTAPPSLAHKVADAAGGATIPVIYEEVGSFLYIGAEYVATSSDDPHGVKLFRVAPRAAAEQSHHDSQHIPQDKKVASAGEMVASAVATQLDDATRREREELAAWVDEKERGLHERAFGKHAPAQVDSTELLRAMVAGDAGRQILQRLADGQGTETEDGKAWLAAQAAVIGPGQRNG